MGSSSAFAQTSHLGRARSRAARTPEAFKSVIGSLAAEGISVDLAGITGERRDPQITRAERS